MRLLEQPVKPQLNREGHEFPKTDLGCWSLVPAGSTSWHGCAASAVVDVDASHNTAQLRQPST